MPMASSSSRTHGATAIRASVRAARRRSAAANAAFLSRREVLLQHVPVERVHDDRRAGASAAEPAERPGLREMGVHDLRPPATHRCPEGRGTSERRRPDRGLARATAGTSTAIVRRGELPSPRPEAPQARRVSNPRPASSRVRKTAWRAGPPTFSRVTTRSTAVGSECAPSHVRGPSTGPGAS